MSNLTNMLEPLRAWWDGATASTRAAAIGLSVMVLAGLVFAATLAASPDYTPIFHGVSGKDASAVETTLHDHNIPMQFDDKTGTVSVPSKDESEATMAVASANIFKDKDSGAVPQGISSSPFTDPAQQQAQTLAANEARVSQILDGLGPVGSSQVIIAPGNTTELFGDNVPPTASVTLNLKQGEVLSDDQISGIVNLVVMSYTGLTAKCVSIVDGTGAPLWDPKSGAPGSGNDRNARADSEASETMRKKLQDALNVFGPQNTRVVVTAELDRDETHIHQIQNAPGTPISTNTSKEKYSGGGAAPVGGPAGTTSNTTGPPGYGADSSSKSSGDYTKTTETVNNVPNVIDTTITKGEGEVKSLAATVLVNSTVPASVLPAIQQAVATTIGARPGDASRIFTVQQVPFDTSVQKAQLASMKSLASQELWANITKVLAVSIAGCILLFILTRSGRRAVEPQLALAGGGANIGLLEGASDRELENILEERPLSIEDVLAEMPDVDDAPRSRRRRMHAPSIEEQQDLKLESIQDMIGSHPESVALLMKGWMVE